MCQQNMKSIEKYEQLKAILEEIGVSKEGQQTIYDVIREDDTDKKYVIGK